MRARIVCFNAIRGDIISFNQTFLARFKIYIRSTLKIYSKLKNILSIIIFFTDVIIVAQHTLIPSIRFSKFDVIDNNNTGLSPLLLFCNAASTVDLNSIYLTAQQSRTCARAFHPPRRREGGRERFSFAPKGQNSIRQPSNRWTRSATLSRVSDSPQTWVGMREKNWKNSI